MTVPAQEGSVEIADEDDIVTARKTAREVSEALGFGITDTTRIVTAVSELARNIVLYADEGEMRWSTVDDTLEFVFEDEGPGIEDLDLAMEEGYSTSGSMGKGLSGTQRLMDEMEISSEVGKGTTVTVRKHLR